MTTIERSPTRFFSYLFYLVLLMALSVAIYFFIAQQFLQPAPEVPSEVVFETPAPSPLIVSPADVQFAESFDQDLKAWQLSPAGQAAFDRGALVLDDNRYNDFGWARPHLTFDNFVLEVYARWLGGAIGGGYGVEFRVDDESGDFYAFYLHNDGRFTAGKRLDGTWFAVVDEFSPAVQRGGGLNRIRIEALGERLRFFVNDTYLVDIHNQALTKGDIRLVARKIEGTEQFLAAFDDLIIARIPPAPAATP